MTWKMYPDTALATATDYYRVCDTIFSMLYTFQMYVLVYTTSVAIRAFVFISFTFTEIRVRNIAPIYNQC